MSGVSKVKVKVEVEVNPTEDIDKVRVAIQRVLGEFELKVKEEADGKRLVGRAEGIESLSSFRELLRRERIRDAAKAVLLKSLRKGTITFYLNKQVAYVGHISFSQPEGESPLGPICVQVECEEPRELIYWLTLKTS